MQPHLAKFLENNEAPSEAVRCQIKELLQKPLHDLEKLTVTLKELAVQRVAIQKSIDEYTSILSPVRQIPFDILHEIFYHCLPTHYNAVMSITEAPLLLTRICKSWRSVALSSHRIWAKLHIPLLPYSIGWCLPQGVDNGEAWAKYHEQAEKSMEARRKLTDIWLSRSGAHPLSISLAYISNTIEPVDNTLPQLFNTILSFSQRFDELELSMPFEIYLILQARISIDMISRLRTLRIRFSRKFRDTSSLLSIPRRSIILLQAPNLQRLSLVSDEDVATLHSRSTSSTWEKLTYLSLHSAIRNAEAIEVLRRCRNLDCCKLIISDGQDAYVNLGNVLLLPRLQTLCIQIDGNDTMSVLYGQIDAPVLNWFDYQVMAVMHHQVTDHIEATSRSSVPSLLERSTMIRKLSFNPCLLTTQDILFSFRFSSLLTHLILGRQLPFLSDGSELHTYGYWIGAEYFNFDLLTIEEDSDSHISHPASRKEILLPKLEVFEAYLAGDFRFTEESLRQFVVGRLGDPARKGVSSLRAVKVVFEIYEGMDISEEVYQRATEVGVEIVFDLLYPPDPWQVMMDPWVSGDLDFDLEIFSPRYGLSETDRECNYPDF